MVGREKRPVVNAAKADHDEPSKLYVVTLAAGPAVTIASDELDPTIVVSDALGPKLPLLDHVEPLNLSVDAALPAPPPAMALVDVPHPDT